MLLSAAMIVRDEEPHLEACLSSLAAVVDEVVVVDTGSSDGSVAVARSLGARTFREPWAGDFARARNAALERAAGRWILYIDADERLRPVDRASLERLLIEAAELAFRVLLHPFERSTPYREYRLWRNDPRIRFRGAIHEKVVPAIEEVTGAEGATVGDCELVLDHIGYGGDQTPKHRRNLPLLRAQLEVEADNVFNWRHLGVVLSELGEPEEAERALWRAIELTRADRSADQHGSLAYADLVRLRHERGEEVGALLDEALERYPDNWLLVWTKARLEIDAERYESALPWLEGLVRVEVVGLPDLGIAYDERIFGSFAQASRGLCLLRLGRYAEAEDAYSAAEAFEPGNPEHRVKRELAASRARGSPSEPSRPVSAAGIRRTTPR
jgi:glycosyltransferase involved in cell wall biosynthesis